MHSLKRWLGTTVLAMTLALPAAHAVDWPSGYSKCADEGGTCRVGTTARSVSFGIKDRWVIKALQGDKACTVATFGSDPYPGLAKKCAIGPAAAPAPAPWPRFRSGAARLCPRE